jgi:hypothetical protein
MELLQFAALYICIIAAFLFVMLFGECAFFEGTPVARAHALLTGGVCEMGMGAVSRLCGARGKAAVDAAVTQCCDRPNPALQARGAPEACSAHARTRAVLVPTRVWSAARRVSSDNAARTRTHARTHAPAQLMYIALVSGGYLIYLTFVAPLLPGPYASETHLCVALSRFARASCARSR